MMQSHNHSIVQSSLRAIVQSYNDAILLIFFNRKNIQNSFDDSIIFLIFANVEQLKNRR
jgi:hypothetical protein